MTQQIKIFGVAEALKAFRELPRRVGFKHLRIALNAGGGIIRDRAAALVRRDTGLLSKSIGVKVTIPDSSFNGAHHGRPAYAIIGPKRKSGRLMKITAKGLLKGHGKAQSFLVAERKRLKQERKVAPLQRERAAVAAALKQFGGAIYRNPTRYAHLVEKRFPWLGPAVSQTKDQVLAKIESKLADGVNAEARALSPAGA